jgi:ABC-type transport system involved in cytochrome c biogenesis permease subunit
MKSLRALALLLLAPLATLASASAATTQDRPLATSRAPWSDEVIQLFATLPVQEGGRVKPLDTLAGFTLLKMNSKRTVRLSGDRPEKLGPTAWALDCLFYPELASTYRTFYVRDSAVLTGIGLSFPDRKKTDRYSYDELVPGRQKLFAEADRLHDLEVAGQREAKDRTTIERQIMALAENMGDFESLAGALDFARHDFVVDGSESLRGIFGGAHAVPYSRVLVKAGALRELASSMSADEGPEADPLSDLFQDLQVTTRHGGHLLAVFAPETKVEEQSEWLTPTELGIPALMASQPVERSLHALGQLEELVALRDKPADFTARAGDLNAELRSLAEARGEYGRIPLEVSFYRWDFFTNALVCFLVGFLGCALSWLAPRARPLTWLHWGGLGAGTLLAVAGIVMRCIIRERPPISTLYETILFITATAVITAMLVEYLNPQRIALALAPVLGAGGMFLAMRYEFKEAVSSGDTMPSLVAVLDTNFWLATHVTIINLGYMSGLLASALAHVWLIAKVFGLRRGDKRFYRELTRMTYGVLCFGLLFALVGTILGGIWANYSWGRFWGWDPKENGALLIVLSMLTILHGRMGGYLRDFGLAVATIGCGMVVAFSWWGVNFLGIGLHSYGFTEGVLNALLGFWAIEAVLVLGAIGWWLFQNGRERGAKPELVTES